MEFVFFGVSEKKVTKIQYFNRQLTLSDWGLHSSDAEFFNVFIQKANQRFSLLHLFTEDQ